MKEVYVNPLKLAVKQARKSLPLLLKAVERKEIECIPDPKCRCCVCQGKFCNVDHKGHWHGAVELDWDNMITVPIKWTKGPWPRKPTKKLTGRQ